MKYLTPASMLLLLGITSYACPAETPPECFAAEVEAHVIEQFHVYGPLSRNREYFGFVYRVDGVIGSATTRGSVCRVPQSCAVNTRHAAEKIPAGARVLGEWHTHPHESGSLFLSDADVRGANDNRRIRCYRAFFSTADGDVLAWDPNAGKVSIAMSTAVRMGNYRRPAGEWAKYARNEH